MKHKSDPSKPRLLITGGAGYIGSVMARFFLDRGHAVTVLDNFMYRQNSLLDCCREEGFRVVRGDCRDERLLRSLVKDHDALIPLAALVGAPLCDRDRVGARSVNLDAVRSLLTLASPSQRVVYPTTNSGYGVGEKGKFCTEETPMRPISLYGETKVEAEKAVLERENSITFRLATVFGVSPKMRIDLLVNDFAHRAVTDRTVVVFEGHFKRNYIHIRDVAKAFAHALENFDAMKGKPYNLGLEDANLSKIELCKVIGKVVPGFTWMEAPVGEDPDKRDYIVSNARILKTGFVPDWSLERGIRELVKCYAIVRNSSYSNV